MARVAISEMSVARDDGRASEKRREARDSLMNKAALHAHLRAAPHATKDRIMTVQLYQGMYSNCMYSKILSTSECNGCVALVSS